ncbi:MAG: hypothetical protein JSU73_07060 [candidate division WOR-3 bacterium]|nr:MAG: hypothetical protein JSU73_07060 [candidate division WOR-3 bacterium]
MKRTTGGTKYFPPSFYRTCRPALCPACAYAPTCLAAEKEEREVDFVEGFSWLADLNYSHRHTWLKARRDGTVRLGLDDFAQKLIGRVARVELPAEGTTVKKGEPLVALRCSQGEVRIPSPIDGTVSHVNTRLNEKPGLLNEDPYGQWITRLEPFDLDAALSDTTTGDATATWLERDVDRLRYRVDSELGVTAADGGTLVRTVEKIDKSEWEKLVAEFLL